MREKWVGIGTYSPKREEQSIYIASTSLFLGKPDLFSLNRSNGKRLYESKKIPIMFGFILDSDV